MRQGRLWDSMQPLIRVGLGGGNTPAGLAIEYRGVRVCVRVISNHLRELSFYVTPGRIHTHTHRHTHMWSLQ